MLQNDQTIPADKDSVAENAYECDLINLQAGARVVVPKPNGTEADDLWLEHTSAEMVNSWAESDCSGLQHQHYDDDSLKSRSVKQKIEGDRVRRCQLGMLERKTHNGETIKRSWLCFSPANGRIYCFVCKLVASTHSKFTHGGFSDWKHAGSRLEDHEQSKNHFNAVIAFVQRSKDTGRINFEVTQQAEQAPKYWRSLLAEYDDFLRQHMQKHGNPGCGHTNYLSPTICEELIQLMGDQVFNEIISCIKTATPVERFVEFMPNQGHKAQDMFNSLVRFYKEHGIDIKDCRGQSYGNALAMSGRHNSLQPTNRYQILVASLQSTSIQTHVPKRITTTRWSCRADAIKAFVKGFPQNRDTLAKIADDPQLYCLSHDEIQDAAMRTVNIHEDDLDQCLGNQLIQFVEFSKFYKDERGDNISLIFVDIEKNLVRYDGNSYRIVGLHNCAAQGPLLPKSGTEDSPRQVFAVNYESPCIACADLAGFL
ncbi:uncharacterized protein [Neodiprion pinetum]|uniref:uncharacterized protein n=1 Tax=Neodiprion pinetum TaxID=441929 RepID=UPI001EDF3026|nr:uncharacterized protein LOC124224759 [Neodiprion pinetum]